MAIPKEDSVSIVGVEFGDLTSEHLLKLSDKLPHAGKILAEETGAETVHLSCNSILQPSNELVEILKILGVNHILHSNQLRRYGIQK